MTTSYRSGVALQLVHASAPVLRAAAQPVTDLDRQTLLELIRDMFTLMYEAGGVGLAAPQVAVSLRLFVTNPTGQPQHRRFEESWINPEILDRSSHQEVLPEGCLALPNVRVLVERPTTVRVASCDSFGYRREQELSGYLARIFQHEFDHLEGVLITERSYSPPRNYEEAL